jgi:ATP-dependent Clp protease ATP-binding subunit ClpX
MEAKNFICSFCKRSKNEVKKLIAGKDSSGIITFICDFCTKTCYEALRKYETSSNDQKFQLLSPHEMFDEVSKVVEGQEIAKKVICTGIYNHFKRIMFGTGGDDVEMEKSNMLVVGKSGSGKTLIIETLSKILGVPFAKVDANTMTEAGYVGEDVELCIVRLLQEANYDVNAAERGIVFIDEIDKIRRLSLNAGQKDVNGEGVQNGLLKLIEGTTVNVPVNGKRNSNSETKQVNTKNILFICAGAFEDLLPIIQRDINTSNLGFAKEEKDHKGSYISTVIDTGSKYDETMRHLKQEHLIKYGFIPEFLGRLQITVVLHELSERDLINILTKPKNAILKQYKKLLEIKDKAKLEWTEGALNLIAANAKKNNTGARGLKSEIERILLNTMYEIPSMKSSVRILIDEDVIEGRSEPKIINNDSAAVVI